MARNIEVSEYVWYGFAGHLIVADSCRFHLSTAVGDVLVSTVGAYKQPGSSNAWTDVGYNRKFETMVFPLGDPCRCGESCGQRDVASWSDIDFAGCNTPADAMAQHMAMCTAWSTAEKQASAFATERGA